HMGAELDPDFTDQPLDTEGLAQAGVDTQLEGDNVTFAPTDPVLTTDDRGRVGVLNGFSPTSSDSLEVAPSTLDDRPGDEAIADAVRDALRRDARTTALDVDVLVREGVVHLRGEVEDLLDVESAQEVASRVPGVVEVVDQTKVGTI